MVTILSLWLQCRDYSGNELLQQFSVKFLRIFTNTFQDKQIPVFSSSFSTKFSAFALSVLQVVTSDDCHGSDETPPRSPFQPT